MQTICKYGNANGSTEEPLSNRGCGIAGIILGNGERVNFRSPSPPATFYISTLLFTVNNDHNQNFILCE